MGVEDGTLAIEGGRPARERPIEPLVPASEGTRGLMDRLLSEGRYSAWYGGPVALEFEAAFAARMGCEQGVAVNSGTSALHAVIAALDLGPEDEVIVPAAAYISAASAIAQEKALPVLCDIDPAHFTMSPDDLRRRIGPRTRAVMVVHFWGCPADMGPIAAICRGHGLALIEDCGQSHGATAGRRVTGGIGDYGCFSFAPRKHITTGQGGMVTCRDGDHARRVREMVNKGKGPGWLDYHTLGYSYAMSDLQAAIGLDGLSRLDDEIARRRYAVERLRVVLAETPLHIPNDPPWGGHVYFKVPILLPPGMEGVRDFFVKAVSAENVSCRPTHPPVYEVPWYTAYMAGRGREQPPDEFAAARSVLGRALEIESGPNLTDADIEVSARAVLKVWRRISKASAAA